MKKWVQTFPLAPDAEKHESSKIGCKQVQPDHVKWVTATLNAILPCNIEFQN